jgi:Transposase DDE domain
VRHVAQGSWARETQYGRFLGNERVTLDKLIAGWSERTVAAAAGRHVLAIQDTSEIKFATTAEDRRGLGKVKKGNAHGALLHAMIGVDADSGVMLGLVGGQVWTRQGDVATPHAQRSLADKESARWLDTAEQARQVLAGAAMITVVADRESDIYAHWARSPGGSVHLLTRLMHDHAVVEGGTVRQALAALPVAARGVIALRERVERQPRDAHVQLRFGAMTLKRPRNTVEKGLPEGVAVHVVEIFESEPPPGVEPVHWILLTTHTVRSAKDAWRLVGWYQRRWTIEQFFRTMKRQGLRIEDSQLTSADRLLKLVAIAAHAAAIIMQLVQARDGRDPQPAHLAFAPDEIALLARINQRIQGKTARQTNPHPPDTLAWAAWVIAKLGGWHEYNAKPPGPITLFNGLTAFRAAANVLRLM